MRLASHDSWPTCSAPANTVALTFCTLIGRPPVSRSVTSQANSHSVPLMCFAMIGFGATSIATAPWPGTDVTPVRALWHAANARTSSAATARLISFAPSFHLNQPARDARAGVAARLRGEVVGIRVEDDGVADDGVRAGGDGDAMQRARLVHHAVRTGFDVAEVAGVMRRGARRSVWRAGRVEVSAGGVAVVAAVAFVMEMKSVNAGRNSGEMDHRLHGAVGHLGEGDGAGGGRAARRSERGGGGRTHRRCARAEDEECDGDQDELLHGPSNFKMIVTFVPAGGSRSGMDA